MALWRLGGGDDDQVGGVRAGKGRRRPVLVRADLDPLPRRLVRVRVAREDGTHALAFSRCNPRLRSGRARRTGGSGLGSGREADQVRAEAGADGERGGSGAMKPRLVVCPDENGPIGHASLLIAAPRPSLARAVEGPTIVGITARTRALRFDIDQLRV